MEMATGGITEYAGDYDYYLEKKKVLTENADTAQPTISESNANKINASNKDEWLKKKESESGERKRLAYISRVENEIAEIEKKVEECERLLAEGDAASDAAAAAVVYDEKTKNEERLIELYSIWDNIHQNG
jgi:ATP-binding cassette subfamily F protein 3